MQTGKKGEDEKIVADTTMWVRRQGSEDIYVRTAFAQEVHHLDSQSITKRSTVKRIPGSQEI